jgi:hypothetical protein
VKEMDVPMKRKRKREKKGDEDEEYRVQYRLNGAFQPLLSVSV